MKNIYFFANGNSAVFINEEQVPHLQQAWIQLFFDHMLKNGEEPDEFIITLPNGDKVCPIKLEDGSYNILIG
jgi:hypothetical protein